MSDLFRQLVAASDKVELAKTFEVAISTVRRWADGTANPHPLLRKQIMRYLRHD